jgi:thymidylate synthase (FAD)
MEIELRQKYTTPNPDELAAMSARGDYLSDSLVDTPYEEVMGDRDLQEFLNKKVARGHFGVFEHPQASFFVEGLSRAAMAQVTRHRHMSFDVQSQRYVDFSDKEPVIPPSFEKYSAPDPMYQAHTKFSLQLKEHWKQCVEKYQKAIEAGIPKEDARFFLPLAAPVNMTMSANPRSLFHFLDLRNNAKAQWEAQQFAQGISNVASEWAPKSFKAYREKTNNNSLRAP